MNEKPIKVLLVEDNLEDIRLLEEALAEIEEMQYSRAWIAACELIQAEQVSEALEMLAEEPFDVVLLDLALTGDHGPEAFRLIHARAPETPVILLASADEETLAIGLIRQGAQDYLTKPEVDCIPLARCLRCAIERQRFRSALLSLSYIDDLTGLYSDGGFHNLVRKHWKLARMAGRDLRLYLVELEGVEPRDDISSSQERDLSLILAADALRNLFGETDIVARNGLNQFAVASLETAEDKSTDVVERLRRAVGRGTATETGQHSIPVHVGTASTQTHPVDTFPLLLEAVEASLCENKRSEAKVLL